MGQTLQTLQTFQHFWLKEPTLTLVFTLPGKHSGRPSSWMDAVGKEVTLWQQMLERPNFWVEASVGLRSALDTGKVEK